MSDSSELLAAFDQLDQLLPRVARNLSDAEARELASAIEDAFSSLQYLNRGFHYKSVETARCSLDLLQAIAYARSAGVVFFGLGHVPFFQFTSELTEDLASSKIWADSSFVAESRTRQFCLEILNTSECALYA